MKIILKQTQFIACLAIILIMVSCKDNAQQHTVSTKVRAPTLASKELLIGSWLDTSASALHFTLLKDGTARSDNMATLLYTHWKLDNNLLTLRATSIGNGTESTSDEIYTIKSLTAHKMILLQENIKLVFVKKNKDFKY